MTITTAIYLYLISIDNTQVNTVFQFSLMLFEGFVFFTIYGGETLFKVGQVVYVVKVVVSIGWGAQTLMTH